MPHCSKFFSLLITLLLCVFGIPQGQAQQVNNKLLIIYDSSNSMWGLLQDQTRKVEAGRAALARLMQTGIDNRQIGFRAYGHRRSKDCRDSQLMVGFNDAKNARSLITSAVNDIDPKGKTPITYSLQEGRKDFQGTAGDILLVTDGIETCDADPCALMKDWKASNVDIRVHVVGVGLNNAEQSAISCIADISGGQYFDANSAERFTDALTEAKEAVVDAPAPDRQVIAEAPTPKKKLKSTVEDVQPDEVVITDFTLRVIGRDKHGRDYRVAGTLMKVGGEPSEFRSDKRNRVKQYGDYVLNVGPILHDGTTYKPVHHPFSIDKRTAITDVVVLVERPAIVTADFVEANKPHQGKVVEVLRGGKRLFVFQPGGVSARREVLMQPGEYEFRSEPNPDNKLIIEGSIAAGETTELLFELLTTIKAYIAFKLPNGTIVKRHAELWKGDTLAYKSHSNNGVLARPGTYEVRSDHLLLPATPTAVELSENGQKVEIPIAAGIIEITYADAPFDYIARPNRAFIHPFAKNNSAFARPDKAIPVVPGKYRVEPFSSAGYFDETTPFDIQAGQTVKVVLTPKPLGQIIVNYAPSDDYPSRPDRATASPLDGQPLYKSFMRPGKPLKVLPGRYRITGRQEFDMKPVEIEVRAGETTNVSLKLISAE